MKFSEFNSSARMSLSKIEDSDDKLLALLIYFFPKEPMIPTPNTTK
jgi:hypothetical protein